eukprot:g6867.t1
MEDLLIQAFHELDEDGSGRVTRDQLEVLTKKLGIEDPDRLFDALDRNRTGFVTLEDLLNRFYSSSNDDIEEDDEEEMSSNDEEEVEYENDNPVRGIMSLLSPSGLSTLKANEFREALEEYIQRRLSSDESKALSKAFETQRKKSSTFDDVSIGTVLSNWQRLLQGEELPSSKEETNKKMNINIITEEQEATTYVSPAKASRSPRNSLNSENLAEALKRSEHQLRKLREHVQRQRRFIEEQSAAHESVTAKHRLEFERRLEKETRKLRRQFEREHERANESETRNEKLTREKHELLVKIRDLEQERSSHTQNQEYTQRAREEARETMQRLESEYRDTVRDLTSSRAESNRRVETLETELKAKDEVLRNTQSELEEMKRRHTAQNAIHESLRQTIRDLEDVVMTLRGQSPRKPASRSPSPKQRKHRSPSAFARFPKRKSWDSKPSSHVKRSLSVPSRNEDDGSKVSGSLLDNDDADESLADELAALNDVSTITIIDTPTKDIDTPTKDTDTPTKEEEEKTEEKPQKKSEKSSSLVSFLNKQCDEAASLVKADNSTTTPTSSPTTSKKPKRRKSKTSASLVHQMLQEATALAHTFKGDYLEIVTHRQALLRHRIHSAGGSVQERLLFSSVVVRLIQPSKIVGFFSSEARQWRRVLVLTNHALYEMSDVLSLQVRRRVPLSSICTVAMMTDSHDVFALLRRTSYDRVYQTMRRTELVVRIMQACKNLQGLYDDDDSLLGKRRDSVRVRVAQAQKQVDSGEMSRQEFDAVVRSCARYQTRRYVKPPLRVRFLSKMLLSFSGGEIKQMYYNESSGQIHIVPQDARESAPNAVMAGFVCPMCKIKFATAAKLLEHYDSAHPA